MSRSQAKDKAELLKQLAKTPITQVACERSGVPRPTYYRWIKSDKKFAEACADAIEQSSGMISDMAESQLVTAIKEQNMSAIVFWLKHHHRTYRTKIEVDARIEDQQELTPEQAEVVQQALLRAGLLPLKQGAEDGQTKP